MAGPLTASAKASATTPPVPAATRLAHGPRFGAGPRLDGLPEAPARVRENLASLAAALDEVVPAKIFDRNLLVATWNIRRFGGVVSRWLSRDEDRPKRDWLAVAAIAEILSRFDVIAIQEVCGDLRALELVMARLGREWSFLMTDVNSGAGGNGERMAFIYDQRRVALSGLAAEIVVPEAEWQRISPTAFRRQFARAPYAVSFQSGGARFTLVTLHVLFGKKADEGRIDELRAAATWLRRWATSGHGHPPSKAGDASASASASATAGNTNLLALGDFNIDRRGDALWQSFTSTGLVVPPALHDVPRSIFADRAKSQRKYYDQIAWFAAPPRARRRRPTLACASAGSFDFLPHLYTHPRLPPTAISHRISDHYPLWVELTPSP
jgi:endonuclease/exonuclease/phosphatase family metal-dependent hydrolase